MLFDAAPGAYLPVAVDAAAIRCIKKHFDIAGTSPALSFSAVAVTSYITPPVLYAASKRVAAASQKL